MSDPRFIPRPILFLTAFLALFSAVTIAIVAFVLPARRIRREYAAATCTALSATLACAGACRNLTVVSPSFNARATLLRNGRGLAPCFSAGTCAEVFACRFRVLSGAVALREDVASVPAGAVLFLVLAAAILLALGVYVVQAVLKALGVDLTSAPPVLVAIFHPPGLDAVLLTAAVRARWPGVEARGLSYRLSDDVGGVPDAAAAAFGTPGKLRSGVVFFVLADGRTEQAVLDAVPDAFYRVLVLPVLDDCLECASGPDADGNGGAGGLVRVLSSRGDAPVAEVEVRAAYRSLEELSARFDSVYSVGSWEFGNYSWIAVRALSPYVPLRVSIMSFGERVRAGFGEVSARVVEAMCCWRPAATA